MRAGAERRAEENKTAKIVDDVEGDAMMEATGASGLNESDLKYDEMVEKRISQLSEETFGEFYDTISGEVLESKLIKKAREAEMEPFKKREVYEKVPLEECWKVTGRAPVGVKWVDCNKGDKEKLEYRCRLVAKEIKKGKREDFFAATPPLEANEVLFSLFASMPGLCLDLLMSRAPTSMRRPEGDYM